MSLQIYPGSPLTATYTFNGAVTVTEGQYWQEDIALPGAVIGDIVDVMLPQPINYGVCRLCTAEVVTANSVRVTIGAENGSDVEWNAGQTMKLRIVRF